MSSQTKIGVTPWWKGASIYQIYPRSFFDSSGDGTGDLNGVREKMEYLASLGVDAVWLSPFFKSPMADFGYDISDYRAVDPLFGSLDDFRDLLSDAHNHGLKVIIDQVMSHTSDAHDWFKESRADRTNRKADWYVWADAKPDGTAPNNWLSLFGGQAWTWDSRRQQYYLHNFLSSQPDLNFHNPAVRQAQLENARFWLDLGVDGFRFDVVNFYYHDKLLRDNPAVQHGEPKTLAVSGDNPYGQQRHKFDITQPNNLAFLAELRQLMEQYPQITSVGEISDDNPLEVMSAYTSGGDKLHMAYTFDLLSTHFSADYVRDVITEIEGSIGDGWPCWALSNHDVERHNTRWGQGHGAAFAKMSLALLMSMRGSVCLYQGDELGLPQAEVAYDRIQDPYGIPFWPEYQGRDGCRTPMPWTVAPQAGFSKTEPWLPIPDDHAKRCVANQESDSDSVLNFSRAFIQWRAGQPALVDGSITLLEGSSEVLCWVRQAEQQRVFVAINITNATQQVTLPFSDGRLLVDAGFQCRVKDNTLYLPAFQVAFYEQN